MLYLKVKQPQWWEIIMPGGHFIPLDGRKRGVVTLPLINIMVELGPVI